MAINVSATACISEAAISNGVVAGNIGVTSVNGCGQYLAIQWRKYQWRNGRISNGNGVSYRRKSAWYQWRENIREIMWLMWRQQCNG